VSAPGREAMKFPTNLALTAVVLASALSPAALAKAAQTISGQSSGDAIIYRVGGDVKAPRPLSTPLPIPPARTDRQRKVVVSFIVTSEGKVQNIKVVKHFTPDFDTAAVNAVAGWTFSPARKAGKPVAVVLETEIRFTPQ
jgi:TonB family protein